MDNHLPHAIFLFFCFFLAVGNGSAGESPLEVRTVTAVDLQRYLGQWYEIARYPNWFQKKCTQDVTASYTLLEDGKIEVLNRCRSASGEISQAKGKAKIVDKKTFAKLKVTFFWPFYGDYWILDLDPDYRFAVVGEPNRKYLWILSRTPQMDDLTYQGILKKLQKNGFDTNRLVKTKQNPK
jgi:apolipoprotein D and lipocalin family protein